MEGLVREFKSSGADPVAKLHMAQIICMEITLHSIVEEEIFYPAFAHATGDEQLVERARREHRHLKELIARVPEAGNLEGAVKAIWRHALEHIEEERRDIFTKAKSFGMELVNRFRPSIGASP